MCTGKCTMCVGISLIPFAVIAILGNALMFFPSGTTEHLSNERPTDSITIYALFLGGIGGGGILVLLSAMQMICAGLKRSCCANRCGMLVSVFFSILGLAGAGYCLVTNALGLVQGPKCVTNSTSSIWEYPFQQSTPVRDINTDYVQQSYLFNSSSWSLCLEPKNAVVWHISLFSIVMVMGAIQAVLCVVQFINGFFGLLCGTCRKEKQQRQMPLTRM